VPDLETIVRVYLSKLELASKGDARAAEDYDWILLELLDQIVREQSGGEMLKYLERDPLPNEDFVLQRIGEEGEAVLRTLRDKARPQTSTRDSMLHRIGSRLSLMNEGARRVLKQVLLDREERRALAIGRFRLSGESHQWLYDRFSLGRLLESTGFVNVTFHTAQTSGIPDWQSFHLDVLEDGRVAKPDLFFAEAHKAREAHG
jgi:hypothetical protein